MYRPIPGTEADAGKCRTSDNAGSTTDHTDDVLCVDLRIPGSSVGHPMRAGDLTPLMPPCPQALGGWAVRRPKTRHGLERATRETESPRTAPGRRRDRCDALSSGDPSPRRSPDGSLLAQDDRSIGRVGGGPIPSPSPRVPSFRPSSPHPLTPGVGGRWILHLASRIWMGGGATSRTSPNTRRAWSPPWSPSSLRGPRRARRRRSCSPHRPCFLEDHRQWRQRTRWCRRRR